jgi:SAM-dependent methyltransferase
MGTTYMDKIFFLNIIDPDVVVDFGCANGFILSKIKEARPNVKLIGYDLDENMISQAKQLLGDKAVLTNSWEEVRSELKKYQKPALILSSVIHEVYSYSHSSVIKKFWQDQVFGGDFKWIAVRDMIPSVDMGKKDHSKFTEGVRKVRELADPEYLKSFEDKWGPIDNNYRTFVHYLLKYRFTDNWDREVKENYLPVSLETLYKKIPSTYKIIYESNFILPYLQQKVEEDFGIKVTHTTHAKMLIVNTNFRKTNESIIDYQSDNIKAFYDELVELLDQRNSRQSGWGRSEISFDRVVEVGKKHGVDVVNYRKFYYELPEADKSTAPPPNAPCFALVNPTNDLPRVVSNVPSIDRRMLDHIYHMLKHENIHVGQISRRPVRQRSMVNPNNRKEYFSDKDEVMAFSQSIVDMMVNQGFRTKEDLVKKLKYNPLYNDIKRSVDKDILNRYHKYIYLYFEKEINK